MRGSSFEPQLDILDETAEVMMGRRAQTIAVLEDKHGRFFHQILRRTGLARLAMRESLFERAQGSSSGREKC